MPWLDKGLAPMQPHLEDQNNWTHVCGFTFVCWALYTCK